MIELLVQIDRFVDDAFPGFVACSFVDALGQRHEFAEKAPIVTSKPLGAHSTYPQPGVVACEVQREWRGDDGRLLVQVSTELPWGETVFVVLAAQLGKR